IDRKVFRKVLGIFWAFLGHFGFSGAAATGGHGSRHGGAIAGNWGKD
ncbi:hypothetical protein A2U01_0048903, partial [Trifolium medium]|nr:hypothetical protein [Trifolium medium]